MLDAAVNASLTITPGRHAGVRITNDRVGHFFPSGGNWVSLRLTARDAAGIVRWERKALFGKEKALLLDLWPFNCDRRIPFGEQRMVDLSLPKGSGTVTALVRYHDWMRTFRTVLTLTEKF